jgi:hypothetical protein
LTPFFLTTTSSARCGRVTEHNPQRVATDVRGVGGPGHPAALHECDSFGAGRPVRSRAAAVARNDQCCPALGDGSVARVRWEAGVDRVAVRADWSRPTTHRWPTSTVACRGRRTAAGTSPCLLKQACAILSKHRRGSTRGHPPAGEGSGFSNRSAIRNHGLSVSSDRDSVPDLTDNRGVFETIASEGRPKPPIHIRGGATVSPRTRPRRHYQPM